MLKSDIVTDLFEGLGFLIVAALAFLVGGVLIDLADPSWPWTLAGCVMLASTLIAGTVLSSALGILSIVMGIVAHLER